MASPVMVGFVARTISSTPPCSMRASRPADPEIRRLHAVEGRQRTPENVVEAAELECPLERDDVDRLLDHADHRAVAARVRADGAKLLLREVSAFAAEADARLDLLDGSRKLDGVLRACTRERWKVSRCAVLRPIPGSFESWVTRFSTAGLSTRGA